MTIILGRRGDKEPFTCAICGRRAGPFGYSTKCDKPVAWVCNDDSDLPEVGCTRAIRKVYSMATKHLDRYEERAIERATQDAIDSLFGVLIDALHAGGVRKLDDMIDDETLYPKIAEAAAKSNELRSVMTAFLKGFGESIKEQIGAGEAPF